MARAADGSARDGLSLLDQAIAQTPEGQAISAANVAEMLGLADRTRVFDLLEAVMAGDVQLVISGIGTLLPLARGGKVKGLAVTGLRRSALAPEIPTVDESGVSGYSATTWYGLAAPGARPLGDGATVLGAGQRRVRQRRHVLGRRPQGIEDEREVPAPDTG